MLMIGYSNENPFGKEDLGDETFFTILETETEENFV